MSRYPVLAPAFSCRSVPVVFAANSAFVPVFAVCLQSILGHSQPTHNYDLVLLHTDISSSDRQILTQMTEAFPYVSLRFLDITSIVESHRLQAGGHISAETYYRFVIQDVLPDYDKVLYLDCDLIALSDVAELYETDVDGYLLAAVRDAEFLGQLGGARPATQAYCRHRFPMRDPRQYFQAGVLLFNEAEMRRAHSLEQWLHFAAHPYLYHDQDVLNLHCEGRVKYLDMAWNLLHDCDHSRLSDILPFAPQEIQLAYYAARRHPRIIHYAGHKKPWHDPYEDLGDFFWDYARQTPYYPQLLETLKASLQRQQAQRSAQSRLPARIRSDARAILRQVFPADSAARHFLKKLFYR